jgi:hypothetical protein
MVEGLVDSLNDWWMCDGLTKQADGDDVFQARFKVPVAAVDGVLNRGVKVVNLHSFGRLARMS